MARRGRWLFNTCASISLAMAMLVAALWIRNVLASDVYVLWWFRGDPNRPTQLYCEMTARSEAGTLAIRFIERNGDGLFRLAVETSAAAGRRPTSGSLVTSGDPALLSRGKAILGNASGGASHWIGGAGSGVNGWQLGSPHWCMLLVSLVLPIVWVRRRRRESQVGLCEACGYDLRATPSRCPECGTLVGSNLSTPGSARASN